MESIKENKKQALKLLREKKFQDFFELFFSVHVKEEDADMELETWTDGGVDMIIYIKKDNCIDAFIEYVNWFDIDNEIELHRESDAYRHAFTIRQSLTDFETFHEWLEDIVNIIEEVIEEIEY